MWHCRHEEVIRWRIHGVTLPGLTSTRQPESRHQYSWKINTAVATAPLKFSKAFSRRCTLPVSSWNQVRYQTADSHNQKGGMMCCEDSVHLIFAHILTCVWLNQASLRVPPQTVPKSQKYSKRRGQIELELFWFYQPGENTGMQAKSRIWGLTEVRGSLGQTGKSENCFIQLIIAKGWLKSWSFEFAPFWYCLAVLRKTELNNIAIMQYNHTMWIMAHELKSSHLHFRA